MYDYSVSRASADEEADAFEIAFARSWLEKVVALGSRQLARGQGEADEWEQAVDEAASLLSVLSGPSCAAHSVRFQLLVSFRNSDFLCCCYTTQRKVRVPRRISFLPHLLSNPRLHADPLARLPPLQILPHDAETSPPTAARTRQPLLLNL